MFRFNLVRFLLLFLGFLLAASACEAATIGTPSALATGTSIASSATLAIGTGLNSSPAGAAIVVAVGNTTSGTAINSVTDDAGNVYTAGTSAGTGVKARFFWCLNCLALGTSQNITITFAATNTNPKLATAVSIRNLSIAAFDQQNVAGGTGGGGTGSLPTLTTGTLAQPASIVFGCISINAGASDSFTEASGFSSLTGALNNGALRFGYQIVASTAAVTYTPVLGSSRVWAQAYAVFEASGSCFRSTTEVGC